MGTISMLLEQCKQGDEEALRLLCLKYWDELIALARRRFGSLPRVAGDDADVVNSALMAFWTKARRGELPGVRDSGQLHAWLSTVVANKVVSEIRRQKAQKAGGGRRSDALLLEQLAQTRELSPVEHQILAETLQYYVEQLPEEVRAFAALHLAGLNQQEIAERVGCSRRTVIRKLKVVFDVWADLAGKRGEA
jgi:RNA polymerase sigma factor (sigma-70 family)